MTAAATHKDTIDDCNNHDADQKLLSEWLSHTSLDFHRFDKARATAIRERLLTWYDQHRRKLPWRGDPGPPWEGSATMNGKKIVVPETNNNTKKQKKNQRQIHDFFGSTSPKTNPRQPKTAVPKNNDEPSKTFPTTAYGIWVSEIMLQQTRVEAVIPFWIRWMESFPTVQDLAAASEEQVNAHWAGLGFYRRARLLHQAAQMLVREYDGEMPTTVEGLLKLPGIGRYTASAIGSIAYGIPVPVVDGNVCRVLARLTGIANHIKAPALKDTHGWELAMDLIQAGDGARPGDLNQALMEIGATYCSAAASGIDQDDPLKEFYFSTRLGKAFATATPKNNQLSLAVEQWDNKESNDCCPVCASGGMEDALTLLNELLLSEQATKNPLPPNDFARTCGHKVFPLPPPKSNPRKEVLAVAALSCMKDGEKAWLLVRRPNKGLLAGQFEFPAAMVWSSEDDAPSDKKKRKKSRATDTIPDIPLRKRKKALDDLLLTLSGDSSDLGSCKRRVLQDSLTHIFSHVRHIMWVESHHFALDIPSLIGSSSREARWMTEEEMSQVGVTAGVKRILTAVHKTSSDGTPKRGNNSIKSKKQKRYSSKN